MPVAARPLVERLWDKFTIGDDCWEWTASLNSAGYGQISSGPRGSSPTRAHRVVYELVRGSIPEGLTVHHLCRNRACVKPGHMELVSRAENVRRGEAAVRTKERRAQQMHCKRGHEFTPENTYIQVLRTGSVARSCRACHALRELARKRGWPSSP